MQTIVSICVVVFCTTLVGLLFYFLIKGVRERECRKINEDEDAAFRRSYVKPPVKSFEAPTKIRASEVESKAKSNHTTKHNAKYPRTGK